MRPNSKIYNKQRLSHLTGSAPLSSLDRLTPRQFNSYGSRRGNEAVMVRGTFANIRIANALLASPGPRTVHVPSGAVMDVYDAAARYRQEGTPLVVLAGAEYGCGSSRDWAAKGPALLVRRNSGTGTGWDGMGWDRIG